MKLIIIKNEQNKYIVNPIETGFKFVVYRENNFFFFNNEEFNKNKQKLIIKFNKTKK